MIENNNEKKRITVDLVQSWPHVNFAHIWWKIIIVKNSEELLEPFPRNCVRMALGPLAVSSMPWYLGTRLNYL